MKISSGLGRYWTFFKRNSHLIWGGIPVDFKWTITTQVFIQAYEDIDNKKYYRNYENERR